MRLKAAFTVIELVFVIVILGVLAAVAVPKLFGSKQDAEVISMLSNISTLQKDITAYAFKNGSLDIDIEKASDLARITQVKIDPDYPIDDPKRFAITVRKVLYPGDADANRGNGLYPAIVIYTGYSTPRHAGTQPWAEPCITITFHDDEGGKAKGGLPIGCGSNCAAKGNDYYQIARSQGAKWMKVVKTPEPLGKGCKKLARLLDNQEHSIPSAMLLD